MAEGTVKSFDSEKGYGFITREGGSDVYFNRTAIQGEGVLKFAIADRVQFEVEEGPKGPRASNVRKL